MANLETLVNDMSGLTLMETSELVKHLESKLGVSAAAPVVAAAPRQRVERRPPAAEAKTAFDVVLKEAGLTRLA